MNKLSTILKALDAIAPLSLAEPWDNVGLIAGDPGARVSRAIACIDYTPAVAREAREQRCELVLAYHPPLFDGVKKITADGPSSLVFDAIARGVAIYSPHTALDIADGGTNDMLADALALQDRRPLKLISGATQQYKLVTFVPESAIEAVSTALFDAGAGHIGKYSSCGFRSEGTATFFGSAETRPAVGQSQTLEKVPEIRVETLVPIEQVAAVLAALKHSHPYEEPAFDLLQLAAPPRSVGMGRIGTLPGDVTADMLINRLKRELGIDHVLAAGDTSKLVRRAAVCAGSCGKLLDDVLAAKADLYLTGEMRHHDAIKAARCGLTVVCTLHSNSERAVLKRLAQRLRDETTLEVLLSQADQDPFRVA